MIEIKISDENECTAKIHIDGHIDDAISQFKAVLDSLYMTDSEIFKAALIHSKFTKSEVLK